MPEEGDPRFKPIKFDNDIAIIPDRWRVDFFASAGELSLFYKELKENARLMGTRCPECGSVYFWPRSWCHDCYVDCEWVEMSGKGKTTVSSEVRVSLSELQTEVPYCQGGVYLDEARYPIVAFLKNVDLGSMSVGMPVRAEFLPSEERTGRTRDFYFVPDE
jgi:uncharacterized OB-fold protein